MTPPLETPPLPPSQAETARLTIHIPISVGSDRGVQILTCSVTPPQARAIPGGRKDLRCSVLQTLRVVRQRNPRRGSLRPAETTAARLPPPSVSRLRDRPDPFPPPTTARGHSTLPTTSRGKAYIRPVGFILIERLDGPSIRDSLIHSRPKDAGKDAESSSGTLPGATLCSPLGRPRPSLLLLRACLCRALCSLTTKRPWCIN